jgi:uncharacterized protein YndB with AHSA1/START domain
VKKLSITREIDAPADVLWWLFTDPEQWPKWGPSVRSAELHDGKFEQGATGTVTTPVGIKFGFEITDYVDGASWAWKVASVPATHHTVESLGADRCRVGFGVPWVVAPYLAACEIALRRIGTLAVHAALDLQVQQ